MNGTEERARAAMRAIAGTVHDAPPLRLPPAREAAGASDEVRFGAARPTSRGRGRRSWLAPVAAAAVITALAVALAIIRSIPNGGLAAPSTATPAAGSSAASGAVSSGVPEYYVAWMQADPPYLVVGDTFTGQTIATVKAPVNIFFDYVYGAAADDRSFIVTGANLHGPDVQTHWYLLRITPDGSTHARLTPLPIPVRQIVAGAALSPDGTEVAVALPGHPATLRVYSVATGALLRQWSTTAPGELMAVKVPAGGSSAYTPLELRWSADGRQLAFGWNATAIRVLDAAAPDGDLIAGSRPVTAIGTTYATLSGFTCHAANGWQLISVAKGAAAGQGVVCAGGSQTSRYTACSSPADTKCAYTQRNFIGFLRVTHDSQGATYQGMDASSACPSLTGPDNAAYLGWASADGSVIIGSQVCAGHSRFGIFSGSGFTPLPALPNSLPVTTGVLEGTFAW